MQSSRWGRLLEYQDDQAICLKPNVRPVRQKQYPIKLETRKGLEPLIENFIEYFGTKIDCICTSHGNNRPGTEKQTLAFPKQAVLLEQKDAELKVTNLLNPAVFLTTDPEAGELTTVYRLLSAGIFHSYQPTRYPSQRTWTGSCL